MTSTLSTSTRSERTVIYASKSGSNKIPWPTVEEMPKIWKLDPWSVIPCFIARAICQRTTIPSSASLTNWTNSARHRSSNHTAGSSRFGRRTFPTAGPRIWNFLPDHLRDPSLSSGSFRSALKIDLPLDNTHRNTQRSRGVLRNALYKSTIVIIIIIIITLLPIASWCSVTHFVRIIWLREM